jgi:hypothetical protein
VFKKSACVGFEKNKYNNMHGAKVKKSREFTRMKLNTNESHSIIRNKVLISFGTSEHLN